MPPSLALIISPNEGPLMSSRYRLEIEELDQRILPSLSSLAPALTAAPPHALAGHAAGTYVSGSHSVNAGETATLNGTATLARLGHVTVTGTITGPGNVRSGHAWGTLTFTNVHGRVTVFLQGPLQAGFSPLPKAFHYHVVSGTGAYRLVRDQGVLTILWHPIKVTPVHGSHFPLIHGTFTISIPSGQSGPPRITSGIDGVAVIGPLFPVAPAGIPNSLPVPGAIIAIEPAGGGAVIARVRADASGHFTIKLPPGRYRLVPLPPLPGEPFPHGVQQIVVVLAGRYTHVTATFNTGIV